MHKNETIFGPEHPPILIRMTYLASTYHNPGLWKGAEVLEVQVMEAGKKVPGLEHPDTLGSMASLCIDILESRPVEGGRGAGIYKRPGGWEKGAGT